MKFENLFLFIYSASKACFDVREGPAFWTKMELVSFKKSNWAFINDVMQKKRREFCDTMHERLK